MEGDIEPVEGVLRITRIRLHFRASIPAGSKDRAERALQVFASSCPAYQSVKECIHVSWNAEFAEEKQ